MNAGARNTTTWVQWLLGAIVTVTIAVLGGVWAFNMNNFASNDRVSGIQRDVERQEKDLADLRGELRDMRKELSGKLDRLIERGR